jgi:hypothetical protein
MKAKDVTTGPRIHVQTICSIKMEWKQNAKGINHPNEDDFRNKQHLHIWLKQDNKQWVNQDKNDMTKVNKVEIYYNL